MFNSLPNDKILYHSNLKDFAENKINVTEKFNLVFRRVENKVQNRGNAVYQHFLLFPQWFQKVYFFRVIKKCGKELTL